MAKRGKTVYNLKKGMGGSNGGRSRHEKTEILKETSKKCRRNIDKAICDNEIDEIINE